MKIFTDNTTRRAVLSVLLASLIVLSGCAGFLSDGSDSNETETSTSGPAQDEVRHTNGTDLRSMSIPENGSVSAAGELDHGDPKEENRYYEPVKVAAVEGQIASISVEADNGNPAIRAVAPNGNTTQTISNEEGNTARFINGTFTQSGRYTFEVTSVEENATFNYTLTIERVEEEDTPNTTDGLFESDPSRWTEAEQYLYAADGFVGLTNEYTDNGNVPENTSEGLRNGSITANTTGDYVVVTYEMSAEYNFTQRNELDVAFQLAYEGVVSRYREFANDTSTPTDESWVPEIIFFKGVDNETGELLRTTFYTKEWARQYVDGEIGNTESGGNYYSTEKWGPASSLYDVGGFETVTADEFPQTYWNYTERLPDNTTLAERYGL